MRTIAFFFFSLCILTFALTVIGCGGIDRKAEPRVRSSGPFAGSWNVSLKGKSDTCGLGLKGKVTPVTVSITQNRLTVRVAIQGLGKRYNGTVSGKSLAAAGTYRSSGTTVTGTIRATLKTSSKLSISRAALAVKASTTKCQVIFTGSGVRK